MRGNLAGFLCGLLFLAACTTSDSPSSPDASTVAARSPAPSSTVTASPEPGLGIDDLAEVTVDRLNLRSTAGTSGASIGLLPLGTVGIVAGGPVDADGYTWYALAGPGLPYETGCEPALAVITCPVFFGWAAAADLDGTPWLAEIDVQCPDVGPPTTIDELVHMQPGLLPACLGGKTLTLEAYIAPVGGGRGCPLFWEVVPEWLHPCDVQFLQGIETEFEAQGPELAAHLHPSVGDCDFGGVSPPSCPLLPYRGQWVEVQGVFDHPQAASCIARAGTGTPPDYPLPDPALVVYQCRASFVITSITPTG